MPIALDCRCGAAYKIKDEHAGSTLQCPACQAMLPVPALPEPAPLPEGAEPAFHRDRFLLRQKHLSISEKYFLWDEHGRELLFIERPAYLLKNLAAMFAGIAAAVAVAGTAFFLARAGAPAWLAVLVGLGAAPVLIVTAVLLAPKRDVTFYRDANQSEVVLRVLQDQKWAPITPTFTVMLEDGTVLARIGKNVVYDLFRKRWQVHRPDGTLWATAREDSLLLALLRRFLGHLYGLLRTNYVILRGDTEEALGEFNRKMTLLDRYVLDMSRDPAKELDRRVAAALGVLLDTGEHR
jgi:hypothetical protein